MNDSAPASDESNPVLESESATVDPEIEAIEAAQERRAEIFYWLGLLLVLVIVFAVSNEYSAAARAASPAGTDAGFPLDDAWIHQVYARSLAQHGAFEYNPGQTELGLSSLLFAALTAPLHRDGNAGVAEIVDGVRTLGAAFWFLLALAAAALARAIPTPAPRLAGFAAALLVAFDPRLGFAAGSGMEPLLFASLTLFAVERVLRSSFALAGLGAALAILARPEGVVVAGMLALVVAFFPPRDSATSRLGAILRFSVPSVIAVAGWSAFCVSVSGDPLPNTFYAKSEFVPFTQALSAFGAIWIEVLAESPYYRVPTTYLLLVMALVGAFARGKVRVVLAVVATPLVFALAIALTRSLPSPGSFYWSRYFLPLHAFSNTLLGIGIAAALTAGFDVVRRRMHSSEQGNQVPAPISALLLLVLAALPFGSVAESLHSSIESFGKQVADVDRTNVAAARWLAADTTLAQDAVIAAQDAGAVRYFGERPVLDLLGLNDHRIHRANRAGGGESVRRYLESRSPQAYFLLDPDPGAADFVLLARVQGMMPMQRFEAPDYSLFGAPQRKGVVLYFATPTRINPR